MTEVAVRALVLLVLPILAWALWDFLAEGGGTTPVGRPNAVADNPSGEETRRDLTISAGIVVACMSGVVAVAAVVVWLMG